jgi:hypothetical protein
VLAAAVGRCQAGQVHVAGSLQAYMQHKQTLIDSFSNLFGSAAAQAIQQAAT